MAVTKRSIREVDVLDVNGKTYTYTVRGCETDSCATCKAQKMHGEDRVAWVGNVRIYQSPFKGYGKIDVTKNFRRERKASPTSCAVGSFRAKKSKNGALLTFCCPKGKWDRRRQKCRVSMKLQSLGHRRRR